MGSAADLAINSGRGVGESAQDFSKRKHGNFSRRQERCWDLLLGNLVTAIAVASHPIMSGHVANPIINLQFWRAIYIYVIYIYIILYIIYII